MRPCAAPHPAGARRIEDGASRGVNAELTVQGSDGKAENFKRGRMGIHNYSRGCGLLLASWHWGYGWRRRLQSTLNACIHPPLLGHVASRG